MRRTVAWLVALLWLAPSTATMVGCGDDDDGPRSLPNSGFAARVAVVDQCARVGRPIQVAPQVSMTFDRYICETPKDAYGDGPQRPAVDFGCGSDSTRECSNTRVPSARRTPYRIVSATCAPDCTAQVVEGDLGERVDIVGAREAEANVEIVVEVTVDETAQVLQGSAVTRVEFEADGRCKSAATSPSDAGTDEDAGDAG